MRRAWPIGLVLLVLAGCGGGGAPPELPREEKLDESTRSPWLRLVLSAPPVVDPLAGSRPFQLDLRASLYPSLIRFEGERGDGAVAVPDLALSWNWHPERTELVLRLDSRRRWSDGNPVDPVDVVGSYQFLESRGLLPVRPGPRPGAGSAGRVAADALERDPRGRDRILREVAALGDTAVAIRFVPGVPSWLALEVASIPILSAVEIERRSGRFTPEPGIPPPPVPIAAPFRLEPSGESDAIRLRARSDVDPAFRPRIAGIEAEVLPGDEGRIERVRRGQADLAFDVPPDRLARQLREEDPVEVRVGGTASVEMLLWNLGRKELDSDLRRAVDLAIDRGRIALLFRFGGSVHAVPGGGLVGDGADPQPGPDPEAAAAALGYAQVPPSGAPPRRFVTLLYDRNNRMRERIATYLEEDLSRIGIALRPIPLDGPAVFSRFLAGEFEIVLLGFRPPISPDPSGLFASWGSWNGMGYSSATVDSLVGELYRAEGPDGTRLGRLIEREVRRDRPVTFLVRRQRLDLVHLRVRGLAGDTWAPLGRAWRISLEESP